MNVDEPRDDRRGTEVDDLIPVRHGEPGAHLHNGVPTDEDDRIVNAPSLSARVNEVRSLDRHAYGGRRRDRRCV